MEESKDFQDPLEEVSRSQQRREALEVKSLASRLIALPAARLAKVPLDDQLRSEIDHARSMKSHGARKRQLQYVAKLMRRNDPEPIQQTLESFETEARHLTARHHRSEAWRDFLLENGDRAVGSLLDKRRDANAQAIRQLLRNAAREASRNKPPAAARSLFKLLRELDETEPLPPVPTG